MSGCVFHTGNFKFETFFLCPYGHKLFSDWICISDVGLYNQELTWFKISQGYKASTAREQGNAASSMAYAWLSVSRLP